MNIYLINIIFCIGKFEVTNLIHFCLTMSPMKAK